MKKLATAAGSIALFAATLVPALAVNNCTNGTTGPFSSNFCTINNASNVTINNVNDAQILNNVTVRSNTGNNSASNNTLGGTIVTGNASLNATVQSVANINTLNITGGAAASDNTAKNDITGPSSNNVATVDNKRRVDVWNSNTATVNNDVDLEASSGDNRADNNTGPATVMTGNTWLRGNVATHVNDNLINVTAGAGGTGNNTAENGTTGPFSSNFATINNTADANVRNVNDLIVKNFVRALSNTGNNSASNNTLGGDISTGNATANVTVDTEGNLNVTLLALAMGGFANHAGSDITGPGSTNSQTINNDQNVTVDTWNNKCQSHNADRLTRRLWGLAEDEEDVDADHKKCDPRNLGVVNYDDDEADAGSNRADNNTAGGIVTAGRTDLIKQLLTHLNDSFIEITQ